MALDFEAFQRLIQAPDALGKKLSPNYLNPLFSPPPDHFPLVYSHPGYTAPYDRRGQTSWRASELNERPVQGGLRSGRAHGTCAFSFSIHEQRKKRAKAVVTLSQDNHICSF